jgi:NADH-quinone oxidoreductase subunit L
LRELGLEFHGPAAFVVHAFTSSPALYLAAAGVGVAWFLYLRRPELPAVIQQTLAPVHRVLVNKYYFDWFNENVLARAARGVAYVLSRVGDQLLIDGLFVNGSARVVAVLSGRFQALQSGYLYHYAFAMIIGLAVLLGWLIAGF